MASSPPPVVEDQARLLEDALGVVRQQMALMRRCLETPGKLMDALKCRFVPLSFTPETTESEESGLLTCVQFHACIRAPDVDTGTEAVLRTLHGGV